MTGMFTQFRVAVLVGLAVVVLALAGCSSGCGGGSCRNCRGVAPDLPLAPLTDSAAVIRDIGPDSTR